MDVVHPVPDREGWEGKGMATVAPPSTDPEISEGPHNSITTRKVPKHWTFLTGITSLGVDITRLFTSPVFTNCVILDAVGGSLHVVFESRRQTLCTTGDNDKRVCDRL